LSFLFREIERSRFRDFDFLNKAQKQKREHYSRLFSTIRL